jgi:hypothetical protein
MCMFETNALQYLGSLVLSGTVALDCGGGRGGIARPMCPTPGTLGLVSKPGDCTLPCSGCSGTQTCDAVFGLCHGASLLSVDQSTTAASAAGGGNAWLIPVAVAVPLAVLVGVAAAIAIVVAHRRSTAAYDRTANTELRLELLDETQKNRQQTKAI